MGRSDRWDEWEFGVVPFVPSVASEPPCRGYSSEAEVQRATQLPVGVLAECVGSVADDTADEDLRRVAGVRQGQRIGAGAEGQVDHPHRTGRERRAERQAIAAVAAAPVQ